MYLTFDADHVKALLQISEANPDKRRATMEQMMDPTLWKRDIDPDRAARARAELDRHGFSAEIQPSDIDPELLEAGLWLVGDQGVYLLSNVPNDVAQEAGHAHVAYAREADPNTMDPVSVDDIKRSSFGPDDGVEYLSSSLVQKYLDSDVFVIDVTPEQIGFPAPDDGAPSP